MTEKNQNQLEKANTLIQFEKFDKRLAQGEEQTKKIEKFITNMNEIMQKMIERLESIQRQNTKLTMKYNGIQEENNKLISEQIQKRTLTHKEQFVSIDDFRATRVNIKEIQIKLKYKLEIKQFQQDISKIKSELIEAVNASIQRDEKCSKTIQTTKQQLKKKDQNILELLDLKDNILRDSIERINKQMIQKQKQTKQKIQKTKQELLNNISERHKINLKKLEATKEQLMEQSKKIVNDSIKRETQIIKDFQEQIRIFRNNIFEKFHQTNFTIDKINTRIDSFTDQLNNQVKNIKNTLNVYQNKLKQLEQSAYQINQQINKIIEDYVNVKQRFQYISEQLDKIQKQFKEKFSVKYMGEALDIGTNQQVEQFSLKKTTSQSDGNIKKPVGLRKYKNNLNKDQQIQERESEDLNVEKSQQQKIRKIVQQPINIIIQSQKYKKDYNNNNYQAKAFKQLDNQIKTIVHNLKLRIDDIQHKTNIIKQIIDSKANQSDLLKLHQSKLPKFALKEFTKKLDFFKNILEMTIPSCSQMLQQFKFEDNQLSQTYSRLIKLKHDTKRNSDVSGERMNRYSTIYPTLPKPKTKNIKVRKGEAISSHSTRIHQINI